MPNWCTNVVNIIFSTKEEALAFVEANTVANSHGDEVPFTPHRYIPMPSELRGTMAGGYGRGEPEKQKALEERQAELTAKYGHKDWYDWSNANWGSKWDTNTVEVEHWHWEHMVTFRFDTAWAPYSDEVYAAMSKEFPTATIAMSYDEPGMDFGGVIIWRNGEIVDSQEGGSRSSTWEDVATWMVEGGVADE